VAELIVRNIEEELVRELELRAARNSRSAEEEHRQILRSVLGSGQRRPPFKKVLTEMPDVGKDEDFERSQDRGRAVEL
jgi:plasmid stability protein